MIALEKFNCRKDYLYSILKSLFSWIFPLIILIWKISPQLGSLRIPIDTQVTYFPLAKQLLSDPGSFFSSELSTSSAPGIYVYMALFGADVAKLEYFNLLMAISILFLVFDAARRIGGSISGAAAAWIYACSPLLTAYAISPQSEPLFIFLCALWFWAIVRMAAGINRKITLILIVFVAGIALAAATLTRGTYIYWIPAVIFVALFISWRGPCAWKILAKRILASHILAFALVAVFMAHNNVSFGRSLIATGAGAALYFGSNPVLDGYEPPYFNLMHDNASVLRTDISHLSLAGDERLMAVTKEMLRDTPLPILARMYFQKLGAVLFFSKINISRTLVNHRFWRILLLTLSVVGAWFMRKQAIVIFLTGALVYQIAVHIPVLYNDRYSIGALEILITLLAASGIGALAKQYRNSQFKYLIWTIFTIAAGTLIGAYHQRYTSPLMPDLSQGPHSLLLAAKTNQLEYHHWSRNPWSEVAYAESITPSIIWKSIDLEWNALAILRLQVKSLDKRCTALDISFEREDIPISNYRLDLRGRNTEDDITLGVANLIPAGTTPIGDLRLVFTCPSGAEAHFDGIALYIASMGAYYWQKIRHQFEP